MKIKKDAVKEAGAQVRMSNPKKEFIKKGAFLLPS